MLLTSANTCPAAAVLSHQTSGCTVQCVANIHFVGGCACQADAFCFLDGHEGHSTSTAPVSSYWDSILPLGCGKPIGKPVGKEQSLAAVLACDITCKLDPVRTSIHFADAVEVYGCRHAQMICVAQ